MRYYLLLLFLSLFLTVRYPFAQENVSSDKQGGLSVGTFILGAVADVSFPFGEEFKAYSGTGFSGHILAGYSVLNSLLLTLKVGYIKFGEQDIELGGFAKISQDGYSSTATNSQIPLLFGAYFTPGFDPTCLGGSGNCFSGNLFSPYIGLQGGLFFKTYKYESTYPYGEYGDSFQQFSSSNEETAH